MELLHPGRIRRVERRAARLAIRDSTSIYRDGERLVVANADAQWFHELGVKPWLAGGPRDPLSADLIAGYDVEVASTSTRRRDASALATAEAQGPLSNEPLSMLMA
jgi:hypothetical protein